jgi:hypothetical protein
MSGRNEPGRDLPPELLEDVKVRLAAERGLGGRLRGMSTPARILCAFAVLAAVALAVLLLLPRPDLSAYPLPRLVSLVVLLAGAGITAAAAFLRPLQLPPERSGARRTILLGALALPVVIAVLPAAHADLAAHPACAADDGRFLPAAAHCLLVGTLFALPLLAGLLLLDRRDGLAAARVPLLAATAALLGNLALLLYCPILSTSHRLGGHAPVAILLAVVAGLLSWGCNRRRPTS